MEFQAGIDIAVSDGELTPNVLLALGKKALKLGLPTEVAEAMMRHATLFLDGKVIQILKTNYSLHLAKVLLKVWRLIWR
jgi:hypothetical protein